MTEDNYFKYKNGTIFQYASSLAATWIWAPALLISSLQAYNNGIAGFLMFLIPNFLTMIIFSYFVEKVRNKKNFSNGYTMADAIKNADLRQKRLHVVMSSILLILSICVQITGIHTALNYIINDKVINCLIISIIALSMVWKNGLKASIITDSYKYIILVICSFIILLFSILNKDPNIVINYFGHNGLTTSQIWWSFGFTCTLGLLSAPYIDNTMWQRAFSIPKDNIKKTFTLASILFVIIPIIYGYIGFIGAHIYTGLLQHIMLIAILCALISTLDSNLIAIAGYSNREFNLDTNKSKIIMILVLLLSCGIFIFDLFDITKLFLSYNTIRVCMVLPTLFIVFNQYDNTRLYYGTLLSCLICPIGFILTNSFIFTVLGLLFTIIGYKNTSCTLHN